MLGNVSLLRLTLWVVVGLFAVSFRYRAQGALGRTHYLLGESRRFPYFTNIPNASFSPQQRHPSLENASAAPYFQTLKATASCEGRRSKDCRCYWANTAAGYKCYVKERISNHPRKQVHAVVDPIVRTAYDSRWEVFSKSSNPSVEETPTYETGVPHLAPNCRKLYHDAETAKWYCIPIKKDNADMLEDVFSVRTKAKKLRYFTHVKKDPSYAEWIQDIDKLHENNIF